MTEKKQIFLLLFFIAKRRICLQKSKKVKIMHNKNIKNSYPKPKIWAHKKGERHGEERNLRNQKDT